jgi:hypothetical protein
MRASTTRSAEILGVQVQQMLAGGQEVIIGAVTDPAFGKLVAFGLGGILVEVLKDITFRLAPATREDALSMLDGIAAAEILRGCAAPKPVDRDALASMIEQVSRLVADFPEISEFDLNPVFATERGATAADVRVVLDFNPPPRRATVPSQEDIVRQMNRIMKPDAVAVIGASPEKRQDRQLGDEESDQRRLPGRHLSDSSQRRPRSWARKPTRASRTCPARSMWRCSRFRRNSSRRR